MNPRPFNPLAVAKVTLRDRKKQLNEAYDDFESACRSGRLSVVRNTVRRLTLVHGELQITQLLVQHLEAKQ